MPLGEIILSVHPYVSENTQSITYEENIIKLDDFFGGVYNCIVPIFKRMHSQTI